MVRQLLAAGAHVVTTVRKPTAEKVAHLSQLPGASERLTIADADLLGSDQAVFAAAFSDCEVLLHTASPFFYDVEDVKVEKLHPEHYSAELIIDTDMGGGGLYSTWHYYSVLHILLSFGMLLFWWLMFFFPYRVLFFQGGL